MRRKWIFKNARNFEENSRFGNHVFFAQKDEILLSMLTEGEFKVIRALRTNTGDYTIGREKSLLVPTNSLEVKKKKSITGIDQM